MLATATLSLSMLLAPQGGGAEVRLSGVPSTVRLAQEVHATLKVETQQRPNTPVLPDVKGLSMQLGSPSSNRSMQIINGRMSSSFSWNYPIRIRATALGKIRLAPIEVVVGGKTYRTRPRDLEVVKEVTGANFGKLAVVPTRKRVYVHEPIRFDVECAVDNKLSLIRQFHQGRPYYLVVVEADWLEALDGAQPIKEKEAGAGDTVDIVLNRSLQTSGVSAGRGKDGKSYHLFRYRKSFLPTRAGKRKLVAPVLKFTVEAGRSRDIFASPRSKEFIVYGDPIEFEVQPLPAEGRPDPYYGGVGRFFIDADVAPRRARVGDSVKLTVTISGTGNMDYFQVPELGELEGFHLLGKNVNRTEAEVTITYDLTATSADVKEVPSVRWNYFDTTEGAEKYVEVETPVLAVDIKPLDGASTLKALPGEAKKAVEVGVDDVFDLRLEATHGRSVLPARPERAWILIACLLPWIAGLLGTFLVRARRRARADVRGQRSKGARKQYDKALAEGATTLDAFVAFLADRLGCESAAIIESKLGERLAAAGMEAATATRVQGAVERGVAARYSGADPESVFGRSEADALVAEVAQVAMRPGAGKLAMWLLVPALFATGLAAQSPSDASGQATEGLNAGEVAYRARDYEKAAEAFAADAAAGNRAAYYNLGNARYRQQLYPQALAAYERARLALPRDPELLANIRLVRQRLELEDGSGEAFAETLASLRDRYTATEQFWFCLLLHVLAAALVCFGGRRLRIGGFVVAVLAFALLLEVAWFAPGRPPKGIVLAKEASVRAEPDAGLDARLKIRAGVMVEVLGTGRGWTRVRAQDMTGYVESDAVAVIE